MFAQVDIKYSQIHLRKIVVAKIKYSQIQFWLRRWQRNITSPLGMSKGSEEQHGQGVSERRERERSEGDTAPDSMAKARMLV